MKTVEVSEEVFAAIEKVRDQVDPSVRDFVLCFS